MKNKFCVAYCVPCGTMANRFDAKMTRLTSELSEMFTRSHALEDEIRKRLEGIGYEI